MALDTEEAVVLGINVVSAMLFLIRFVAMLLYELHRVSDLFLSLSVPTEDGRLARRLSTLLACSSVFCTHLDPFGPHRTTTEQAQRHRCSRADEFFLLTLYLNAKCVSIDGESCFQNGFSIVHGFA